MDAAVHAAVEQRTADLLSRDHADMAGAARTGAPVPASARKDRSARRSNMTGTLMSTAGFLPLTFR